VVRIDELYGGPFNDRIFGGPQADWAVPNIGADKVWLGIGDDQARVANDGSADLIHCGDGHDDIFLVDNFKEPADTFVSCEHITS
jgi:Ca2+-binding RTX toxin-like protein